MKRFKVLIILASLLASLFAINITPVAATGDCGIATVRVYSGNISSPNRHWCYGVNDVDIESEPGNVMGPNSSGFFYNDWDSISTSSGVSGIYLAAETSNYRACIYKGKSYTGGLIANVPRDVFITFAGGASDNIAGSLKFVIANFCPA